MVPRNQAEWPRAFLAAWTRPMCDLLVALGMWFRVRPFPTDEAFVLLSEQPGPMCRRLCHPLAAHQEEPRAVEAAAHALLRCPRSCSSSEP